MAIPLSSAATRSWRFLGVPFGQVPERPSAVLRFLGIGRLFLHKRALRLTAQELAESAVSVTHYTSCIVKKMDEFVLYIN